MVKELLRMNIDENLWIVGLGLYVRDLDALLVADLHLGYEEALSEQGIYVPPVQLKTIKRLLGLMLDQTKTSRLIILGDVKHEFGSALRQEWREVLDLFSWLKDRGVRVEVVRGNHDNFLIPILKRLEVPLHDPALVEEGYAFIHGHKPPSPEVLSEGVKTLIIGHEHPAILFRDELGIKMKFKCFLKGNFEGRDVIVLPALSPLMPGTEVNLTEPARLLSPILRASNIDLYRVYVVDIEAGVYDFGTLANVKMALALY